MQFASKRQSNLGHISIGRILDPVGQGHFYELKLLVDKSQNELYGDIKVNNAKYIHERQWYMEDRELISTFQLRSK